MAAPYSTNSCFDTTIGFLVTQDQVEVCPLSRGVMSPKGATPIQPITGWPLLSPPSFAHSPIGSPCGSLSLAFPPTEPGLSTR